MLETTGLVVTEKVGRTRRCRLGPRRLDDESHWIHVHGQMVEARLDRLGDLLAESERKEHRHDTTAAPSIQGEAHLAR